MNESKRIKELELLLNSKNQELLKANEEIAKTNAKLEFIMDRLNKEIFFAQEIYKLIIPSEIPSIPGFEFSSKFIASSLNGGDYFEIIENQEKLRFGIVLSSATGYMMSSLFLGVLLKYSMQLASRKSILPSDFIYDLANEMKEKIGEKDSLSLFYAIVDRRANELIYLSCGDIYASIWNQEEKKLIEITPSLAPIDKNYLSNNKIQVKNLKLELNPQDRLIVCSKGIYRSQNLNQNEFGTKNLNELIFKNHDQNIHDLRNEILFQAEQFRQKQEPVFDQSVLVMDVKDRVIKLAKS